MNDTLGTLIARTASRDSNSVPDTQFYFEYRLHVPPDIEKIRIQYGDGAVSDLLSGNEPTILERRRVDKVDEKVMPWAWEIQNFAGSPCKAIETADTYFLQAESLQPIHAEWVQFVAKTNKLYHELHELRDRITPHKFQRESPLEADYQYEFNVALRGARLWTAYQNNRAPRERLDAIRIPIRERGLAEKAQIEARIAEIEAEISRLEKERASSMMFNATTSVLTQDIHALDME